jgi:hypothetical protein
LPRRSSSPLKRSRSWDFQMKKEPNKAPEPTSGLILNVRQKTKPWEYLYLVKSRS